jgi:hypothetical protein
LDSEISTIAQSFKNTLLQVERLKQKLVEKEAVIKEKDVTITRLVSEIRFKNAMLNDLRARG